MQTGEDIIKALKKKFRYNEIDYERFIEKHLKGHTNEVNETLSALGEEPHYKNEMARRASPWRLIERRYESLHKTKDYRYNKALLVALPIYDLNARVRKAENGDHVIIYDGMLQLGIFVMLDVIFSLLFSNFSIDGQRKKNGFSIEVLQNAFNNYCNCLRYYKYRNIRYLRQCSKTDYKLFTENWAIPVKEISHVLGVIAFFILCHEQAHIELKHAQGTFNPRSDNLSIYLQHKKKQEYDADIEGFKIMLSCGEEDSNEPFRSVINESPNDVLILFLILEQIEMHALNFKKGSYTTHPSARERFINLKEKFLKTLIPNEEVELRIKLIDEIFAFLGELLTEKNLAL